MGMSMPKQYLPLLGKTVIEHALDRFSSHPRIAGVVVVMLIGNLFHQNVPRLSLKAVPNAIIPC